MDVVASNIFLDESAAHWAGRKGIVIALKSAPFSEMVSKIESRRCWGRVFVINEADSLDLMRRHLIFMRMNNDVAAEQVAMSKNKLRSLV